MIRKILLLIILSILALIIYAYFIYVPQLAVANGYAAKKMCSCSFIADRTQESIQNDDLGSGPLSFTKTKIDRENKTATSTVFGMSPRTAVYRNDVGCILLDDKDDYNINLKIDRPETVDSLYWPQGINLNYDQKPEEVDFDQLHSAINNAFDASRNMDSMKTRAVVVVYKSQLIAESYAKGFDPETEILGWSMTKSITATMIGILVKNGMLSLEDSNLFVEWTDDRSDITLKDMLQMQSGLDFEEDYTSLSDVNKMLFTSEDISVIPLNSPLKYEPGKHWAYSSGTTNLNARIVRNKLDNTDTYLRFPYDSIFNRIGMNSAVMETDESGNFIGSSYCYATPRDWAKFGLLYLNQGNWYGDQIIDTSWVDFVSTPASGSDGIYGGQFWLNVNNSQLRDIPEDLYSCNGFEGQHVYILPSLDLVVVRMGLAEGPQFDFNKFLKEIISAIKS